MAAGITLTDIVRRYGKVVLMKMGFIALGWVVVYFISYIFRTEGSLLTLFAPVIGVVAGLIAGWYMAENAPEDSSLTGLALWVILVLAAIIPMWGVEGLLRLVLPGYKMNFGGFMVLTFANLMALAAAVWHSSSQE